MSAEPELLPPGPNGAGPHRSSYLNQLRQERDDRLGARTLTYRMEPWVGEGGWCLAVRLRALTYAQVMPAYRRTAAGLVGLDSDPAAELASACDVLVAACEEVHVLTPEAEVVRLFDSEPEPYRFDARTCDALGLPEPATAREAVVAIFAGPPGSLGGEFQVLQAWLAYQGWVTGNADEVEQGLLGEA